MAPMIDCVFLLLIFFLVATSFIHPESQVPTDLPRKEQREQDEETPTQFIVMVTKHGRIKLNGHDSTLARLRAALVSQVAHGEEAYVFIDAEDEAQHEFFVKVLDLVREVGAKVTVQPPYEEID
ncbi:MAG: biopolymer transporter ExbD [Verrucomicrobia bacterium]|nr:biopolymer transporter ExbD [Verrucomicrobiota bacterium]